MKIGSSLDTLALAEASTRSTTAARTAGAGPVAGVKPTDQVEVSAAATQMQAAAGAADFDSAKVDAIRQAIREGRFSVNPGAIADRLIADAAALLAPRGN